VQNAKLRANKRRWGVSVIFDLASARGHFALMKKRQIILIHGGSSYRNYKEYISSLKSEPLDETALGRQERKDWKDTLGQKLGRDYDVIYPEMPNWMNAKYVEWKIWFEKLSVFSRSRWCSSDIR